MKSFKKNVLLLTMCSFFLTCCNQNEKENVISPQVNNEDIEPVIDNPTEEQKTCHHTCKDVIVEPTCESQGYTNHKCYLCGLVFNDSFVSALGHDYYSVDEKPLTFEEDGCVFHYECTRCLKYFDSNKKEITKNEAFKHLEIRDYINQTQPVFLTHGNLSFCFDINEYNNLMSRYDGLITKIENNSTSVLEISVFLNELSNAIESYNEAYYYADLTADLYNRKSDYEMSSKIYKALCDVYDGYYLMYAKIGTSNYRYEFFKGYSDQQIADYVAEVNSKYGGELSQVQIEMNEIVNSYKMGKTDSFSTISNFVKKANKCAQLYGASNYMDYANSSIYGRDYSLSDTNVLKTYIKNYIKPLYNEIYQKYYNFAYKASIDSNYGKAYYNAECLSSEFFGAHFDELTDYASFLGEEYYKNYKDFFVSGNYYFSNVRNDNITGYVNTFPNGKQYMFLGREYQSVTTFIHEFGHYNAGITYGDLSSYDLAETQSQGNEMLFYVYLLNSNVIDKLTGEIFMYEQLYSILFTIIYGYAVNEMEKYIYLNENFTKNELESKWLSIGNDLGLDFSSYLDWIYLVLINYNGYYISYVTSAIAALEIYSKALVSLTDARESYKSIYTKESKDETFKKSLTNAGLYDVFDEKAYQLINAAFH